MTPDDNVRTPYRKKFPFTRAQYQIMLQYKTLEQEDGISRYSKTWWDSWSAGQQMNEGIFSVYHETLAEIAVAEIELKVVGQQVAGYYAEQEKNRGVEGKEKFDWDPERLAYARERDLKDLQLRYENKVSIAWRAVYELVNKLYPLAQKRYPAPGLAETS